MNIFNENIGYLLKLKHNNNNNNRRGSQTYLRREQVIVEAKDIAGAIFEFSRWNPEVVIMDMIMPREREKLEHPLYIRVPIDRPEDSEIEE